MSVTLELAAPHSRIRPTDHERGPPAVDLLVGALPPKLPLAFSVEGKGACSRTRI